MSFRFIAASAKMAIRAILLLSLSGLAMAEDEAKIIARVVGEITVNANGSVKAVSLTNVKNAKFGLFLAEKVKTWTFYPMEINGKPVESINEFSFDVIATVELDDTLKKIQLSDVRIKVSALEAEINEKRGLKPSRKPYINYPLDPMNVGAEAKVLLALEVTADGKVRKAELSNIELLNTNRKKTVVFSKYFAKSAITGALKKQWTQAELAAYNCINGCISFYSVDFVMDGSPFWKVYQHVPQAPIPWVIASQLKDMNESEKSQLVRLKDDPTGKPLDMGG
jgi:hypothetical protein